MGNAILYCAGCNTQLRETDFEKGAAFRSDARAWCKACAPEEIRSLPPPPTERRRMGETSSMPKMAPPSSRRMAAVPSSSSKPLLIGGVVVAGIVLLALLMLTGGSESPRPHADPPTPPPAIGRDPDPPRPPPPPPTRNDKPAEDALKRAREFAQLHPENFTAQLALFDTAVRDAEGTGHHPTALRERDAALARQKAAAKVQLDAIDAAVRTACDKEEFAAAIKLIEEARSRPMGPDWTTEIGARLKTVDEAAEKLFAALRKDAAEARKRGAEDEVKRLTQRVEKWGIEPYRADLAKAVAAATPKPKPKPVAPKEADTYRKKWLEAIASAAGRDLAGALKKLEGVVLVDPTVKADAAADAEILKAAMAAHEEGLQLLLRTPKGQKLSLAYLNEAGSLVEIAGTLARAEGGQIDLTHEKGTAQIPVGEIAARSVAQALKGKREARDLALLCLTEGDAEGAKTFVEATSTIPEKYWKIAPAAVAAETDARRMYYSADRDSGSYVKAVDAAQKFASLLKDRAETNFVKRNRALIAARAEPTREFFFAFEDLRIAGAFKAFKGEKDEAYWKSQADSPDAYAELSFAALADKEYRCWAYVGGCCTESVSCTVQVIEGTEPPGEASPAKGLPSMTFKTHASHEGRGRPTPKWGWVQIPLAKFSAPGVKKVRVLSPLKGFCIAQAFVSATRPSVPQAGELRELERVRTEQRGVVKLDPSLVGYWKMNEGSGTTAADSGPFGVDGKLGKGCTWTPSALKLDGTGTVNLGTDLTMLQRVTGVTIAAWICPDKVGGDTEHNVILGMSRNNGATPTSESRAALSIGYGGVVSGGARATDTGKAQTMKSTEKSIKVGTWVHIAAVIDYTSDTIAVYVNGVPQTTTGSVKFEAKVTPNTPSTNGAIGSDDDGKAGFYKGAISDLRLYSRSLTKDEIAELAASR